MGPRALKGGGTAAALVLLALYLLVGGDLDLGGDEQGTTPTTPTVADPAPQTAPSEVEPPPSGTSTGGQVSEQEAAGIAATLRLVESGGPFPHEQDGDTFQNREGLLPEQPQGYYREYTVETPGSDDRGARRLVIGEGGETYYTSDHYESFVRIDPEDYT